MNRIIFSLAREFEPQTLLFVRYWLTAELLRHCWYKLYVAGGEIHKRPVDEKITSLLRYSEATETGFLGDMTTRKTLL